MKPLFRRRRLWFGLLAVVLPLAVMLVMQYRWLARLERTSVFSYELYLQKNLEAVSNEIEFFYTKMAERGLNISPATILANNPAKLAYHFKKRPVRGVRETFVVDFVNSDERWDLYFYDPERKKMVMRDSPDDMQAIKESVMPMWVLYERGTPLDPVRLRVDERRARILLNPITDDDSLLVGLAGFVLDENYFRQTLLPEVIGAMFDEGERDRVVITVRDAYNRYVYSSAAVESGTDELRLPLRFIFTDWELGAHSRYQTPEQWARYNFVVNVTLSGLLALVLIGGIVLALRAAMREMRLSQMKSEFVSNVSHELRTPLASIRVFGEFLRLGRVGGPDKAKEYGEYIETESRRLTHLINNILDFSRIESGHKAYEFETADLRELVREVLRTFEVRLQHAGFEVQLETAEALPPVDVDREAITQALGNLLDNAVKYSAMARRIVVELDRTDGFVRLAVRDYGIGISKEEQQKIFDRFHRVSTGLVHDVKGSGLGLSIVSHVAEAHGGTVTVDSEPGKGSRFTILLPVASTAADEPQSAPGEAGLELDPGAQP